MKKFLLPLIFFLFLLSSSKVSAQGTFDCNWTSTPGAPMSCKSTNIKCDSGYEADFDFCGQKTPLGQTECEKYKNNTCVKKGSSDSCIGTSTKSSGKCIYSTLCPEDTIQDGGYPNVCSAGGRCCVNAPNRDKVFCDSNNKQTSAVTTRIYTAIGCIPVANTPEFIAWILGWAIGIGGGISLMLIIVASFQIMTSSGNPEKVQAGKELLTSAIAGLIMLIFSVFILKVIGVDILKLPGIK